jgi:hypothetical protein
MCRGHPNGVSHLHAGLWLWFNILLPIETPQYPADGEEKHLCSQVLTCLLMVLALEPALAWRRRVNRERCGDVVSRQVVRR